MSYNQVRFHWALDYRSPATEATELKPQLHIFWGLKPRFGLKLRSELLVGGRSTMTTVWESLRDDPALIRLKNLGLEVLELAEEAGVDGTRFPILSDHYWMDRALQRTASTFTIIVIGQVSSGKSSFINSLFGRKLLLPSDSPTDGVVSVLMCAKPHEPEYAERELSDGTVERLDTIKDATTFLRQQDTPAEQQLLTREVRLYLQEPWLRHLRIINTPGLGDRLQAFEQATLRYLHEDESDLVVWTFFPDAAANKEELGVFRSALARRSGSVVGVVTRSLEGKEGDEEYDPRTDSAFVGKTGVKDWIETNLGAYLHDVIFYDAHCARRLVRRMRDQPELQSDPTVISQLERCGYSRFQSVLSELLGTEHERVQQARVSSLLSRTSAHAMNLATVSKEVERIFLRNACAEKEEIAAWERVEKEIIGPARKHFKEDVRALAQERSKELVTIMGNSAADAIEDNFGLLQSIGRSLVSWTGSCDSAADVLNGHISKAVDDSVIVAGFYERLSEAMQRLVSEYLVALQSDLQNAWQAGERSESSKTVLVDPGRPGGKASDVLGDVISGALKGVISAILKSLATSLERRAVSAAAKEVGGQAGKRVVANVGKAAAKQAGIKGTSIAATRIAGVITLVLVPFDIAKLVKDFQKGRDNLVTSVRARYQADRPMYDVRIFDVLWPTADDALSTVLMDARAGLEQHKAGRRRQLESAQHAADASQSLGELATRLSERSRL